MLCNAIQGGGRLLAAGLDCAGAQTHTHTQRASCNDVIFIEGKRHAALLSRQAWDKHAKKR
jgi:hypothetical protein